MQFPRLNLQQLDRLSEIFGNLGLVLLASIIIPSFTEPTLLNSEAVVTSLLAMFLSFSMSLTLLDGGESK